MTSFTQARSQSRHLRIVRSESRSKRGEPQKTRGGRVDIHGGAVAPVADEEDLCAVPRIGSRKDARGRSGPTLCGSRKPTLKARASTTGICLPAASMMAWHSFLSLTFF